MQPTAPEMPPRVRLFDRRALEARDYWMRQLGREVEPAVPPGDFAPGAPRAGTDEVPFGVEGPAFQALARVTRGNAFLVHAAFCAALKVCLYRYRGVPGPLPVAVATPPRPGEGGPAAPNVVCVLDEVDGAAGFRQVLAAVRQTLLDGYAHQGYPFARLMDDLRADDGRRAALASVVLATDGVTGDLPDRVQPLLAVHVLPGDDAVHGRIRFPADRYRRTTMEAFAAHLVALLDALLADPAAPVASARMGDEAERRLDGTNGTARPLPSASVHALFAEQAARTPDAAAVVHGGEALTYGELDARAGRLAAWLVARGTGREARVGVLMERGAPMIVAVLAILRAGAAYLPLDPAAPPERLRDILDDAGASLVLTDADRAAQLPEDGRAAVLDDAFFAALPADGVSVDADPDALAYVIYTSGSTGRPKGVAIPHRGIVRLVRDTDYVALGPDARIAQLSSAAFDAATFEIWGALLNGGAVVVIDRDVSLSPAALAEALRRERITALFLTTALFNRVAREAPDAFSSLEHLLFGGEAVDPAAVAQVLHAGGPGRLLHVYGPTESTTFASWHVVDGRGEAAATVPIGKPVANTTLHVLDPRMQPVPTGVPGELYVGGAGLGRGYLGRPALTAERFVPHPFGGAGERLYRTGDRVRRDAEGALEFLGRYDFQVKVRGFRIEPGEIEAALLREAGVREAVVVVRGEDADRRLVAYVGTEAGAAPAPTELTAALAARLPAYMVPSALVLLPSLPLNASGKVDRAALPEPAEDAGAYVAPRTPTEELLAGVYADVLRAPRVGVEDDFFQLGGHSLLVMQVIARVRQLFGVEVPMRAAFDAPTVAGLALRVDELLRGGADDGPPPLRRVEDDGPRPLSFAQQRLWLVDRLEPGSAAYNVPAAVRMRGPLDADALEQAFAELGRRHETLRTRFPAVDGEPVQVVAPPAPVPLARVDLGALPDPAREAEALRRAAAEALRPFDLAAGPLVRAALLRLADDDHVLLLTLHHIVTDGWSMDVMVRELSALYEAFRRGEPSPLPPLPVRYADFAAWQRAWMSGGALHRQLAWWRERLAGAPPLLAVPTDRPRQPRPDPRAGRAYFRLPAEVSEGLRQLGHREGATLFMVLMAAWQALLARYAGQDDVVVGTPIAGRVRMELEGLIGFFVNMLPVRTDVSGDPSFRALLARVRESTLGAYQHQDLPFERLVEDVVTERALAHAPLFQVSFAFRRAAADAAPGLGEVRIEEFGTATGVAKFDLDLTVHDGGGPLVAVMAYRASLFDDATIQRMRTHLTRLLEAVAADPGRRLSAIPLLDEGERARLLQAWNATDADPSLTPVHEVFAAQAARTPDAPAVVHGGERLTYAALDRAANRLAHALRRRGVGPEVPVGLCMERGPGQVVALLAVLKAGGAYVPLDPDAPDERLAGILADSGAPLLVARAGTRGRFRGCAARVLCLDAQAAEIGAEPATAPAAGAGPAHLAYVIYTSGSTGRPKPVAIPHGALANHMAWMQRAFPLAPGDRVLQKTPFGFDASVWEFHAPLLAGATLVVAPPDAHREPARLLRAVRDHAVTVLQVVPSLLPALSEAGGLGDTALRRLFCGGEALAAERVAAAGVPPGAEVVNLYGPTEACIDATAHRCADAGAGGTVPIGRPVDNVRAYVLDGAGAPVPVGVAGELYLGGAQLARGYPGRPGLTSERFVPDPFGAAPGGRLYRTGDRARWLPSGVLEYLGRLDEQVKIRGFRIEPGEVQAVLREQPGVRDAVVVAREDAPGERRLVAYVAASGAPPSAAALREGLAGRLPAYMAPAAFVVMDALPLSPSGKVDRRALPPPREAGSGGGYAAPESPVEELLCQIWAEVLAWRPGEGRRPIGTADDFFELGGHSILGMRVTARVRRELGVELPLRAVFEAPTVAALARTVEACLLDALSDDELAARLHGLPASGGRPPEPHAPAGAAAAGWTPAGLARAPNDLLRSAGPHE